MSGVSQRSRTALLVVTSVVVVAAIALGIRLAVSSGGDQPAGSAGGDPNAAIGRTWRLDSVQSPDGSFRNPFGKAMVALRTNGSAVADDGVNFHAGSFARTSDGFAFSLSSTMVGSTGGDAATDAEQAGMAAVLQACSARVDGDTLVLSAQGYTLSFHDDGPAPAPDPTPASSTRTVTPDAVPPSYVHGSELPPR